MKAPNLFILLIVFAVAITIIFRIMSNYGEDVRFNIPLHCIMEGGSQLDDKDIYFVCIENDLKYHKDNGDLG